MWAVLRAAEIVALFRIFSWVPLWADFGDFFFVIIFVGCLRAMRLMGDMLIEKVAVGSEDDPGLSTKVDLPCCCCERDGPVGAH